MINRKNKIIIFTDGASKGNPGPGGCGAVIVLPEDEACPNLSQGRVVELGGSEKHTTNNRMELTGAIIALTKILTKKEEIIIYTDSKYLIGGMTTWIFNWQKNGWKVAGHKGDDVANRDLWEKLVNLSKGKKIDYHYVAGHAGVRGNERCDEIASGLATGENVSLYNGALSKYKINILDLGRNE
jgi:ribonuclease HI